MSRLHRSQAGFSLVELMIALVLGLLVGGMILQVFVMNNQSIVYQRASITTQDQGRVALDMMARYIRMAGFQEVDLTSGNLDNGLSGDSSVPSITVRYQAGNSMSTQLFDCLGFPVANGAVSINEFKLVDSDGDGLNDLQCQSTHDLDGTQTNMGNAKLAGNIEQMVVRYGENTDSEPAPNKYIAAEAANMSNVVAIKLCLVVVSDDNMIRSGAPAYTDCNGASVTPSDKRIRRKVSTTITLRNRAGT